MQYQMDPCEIFHFVGFIYVKNYNPILKVQIGAVTLHIWDRYDYEVFVEIYYKCNLNKAWYEKNNFIKKKYKFLLQVN